MHSWSICRGTPGFAGATSRFSLRDIGANLVKTHLEECTTRYLGEKMLFVFRVQSLSRSRGRGTFDLACAFAVLFGVLEAGNVLLTAEVVW